MTRDFVASHAEGWLSRPGRRLDQLRLLLIVNIAASALHFADNAVFLPQYREPTWTRGPIIASWILITAVGLLGYALYRLGHRKAAYTILLAYGLMGLLGLTHYLTVPIWEFSARINTFILLEATAAAGLLATILAWNIRRSSPPMGVR